MNKNTASLANTFGNDKYSSAVRVLDLYVHMVISTARSMADVYALMT